MEHLSNNHEDYPNQHENSHKLCDETRNPLLSLTESQRKLRQQHNKIFSVKGKAIVEQIVASEEQKKCKIAIVRH